MNRSHIATDNANDQHFLPPLVLCEKDRRHFSLVNGKDFFEGEDIYTSIKGGKHQSHDERVLVLGKSMSIPLYNDTSS